MTAAATDGPTGPVATIIGIPSKVRAARALGGTEQPRRFVHSGHGHKSARTSGRLPDLQPADSDSLAGLRRALDSFSVGGIIEGV